MAVVAVVVSVFGDERRGLCVRDGCACVGLDVDNGFSCYQGSAAAPVLCFVQIKLCVAVVAPFVVCVSVFSEHRERSLCMREGCVCVGVDVHDSSLMFGKRYGACLRIYLAFVVFARVGWSVHQLVVVEQRHTIL